MLTLLVAAHELGHYLIARMFKMGVEEFAVGFGRPKWVWKRKSFTTEHLDDEGNPVIETTEYTFRPVPLGGFVRIKGMLPEEDGSETKIPGGFFSKPPIQRFLVLFAGPVFSILAGWVLLIPAYTITGIEKPINEPFLGEVGAEGPAAVAGLKEGDKIISIDGKPINTFFNIVETVRDLPPQEFAVVYERDGKQSQTVVTTYRREAPTPVLDSNLELTPVLKYQSLLGIDPPRKHVSLSIGQASQKAFELPLRMVEGIFAMFAAPSTIQHQVGGPVTIFEMTRSSMDTGIGPLIIFAGLLSIMLGIFNLLPVVGVLDGGHMCVAFVEMLRRGRRLSYKAQERIATIGVIAIVFMFGSVLFIDISRKFKQNKQPEKPAIERPLKQEKADEKPLDGKADTP
ncbi:MAG: site-2 protease family protein [Fimbriimonadaceae bacterium]|nr:site-2 protease family protein [Fimbriimonadaceae bacterium]